MTDPHPTVVAALATAPSAVNQDKLSAARAAAVQLRDATLTVQELTARLAEAQSTLKELQFNTLPDLMDAAGVDRLGLPAAGNLPACDLILTPFFHANIAVSWPEEKRAAAFAALTDYGHEDLIKTEINVRLPRDQRALAMRIVRILAEQFNITPQLSENVHAATLTAWLKEQFVNHAPTPPLDVIGATVGRVARLKERE